jgi:hypothetical protein
MKNNDLQYIARKPVILRLLSLSGANLIHALAPLRNNSCLSAGQLAALHVPFHFRSPRRKSAHKVCLIRFHFLRNIEKKNWLEEEENLRE